MKHSDSTTKIAPALLKAQKAIKSATKSAENPHFKSKYADLGSVIDAVKAPLNDAGIVILQNVTSDSTGVMIETRLLHESTEWIADTLFLPVPQQTPQAYGSAITYGRRYSLQSMVALPAEDDDGNKASEPAPEAPRKRLDAKQECADAFEAIAPEQKDFLRSKGAEVTKLHRSGGDLAAWWSAERFDTEEQLAIWFVLDSDVRAAIKKANIAAREAQKVAELRKMGKNATEHAGQA